MPMTAEPGRVRAGDVRRPRVRHDRPRIALMLVLVVAAMPVRLPIPVPIVGSASILDVVLLAMLGSLLLDLPWRPLDWGYRPLGALLSVAPVISAISLVWSQDRAATLNSTIAYVEALVAYLFVIRELEGVTPQRVITYIQRYALLVTIPGVLLLLGVPGFAPQEPGLSETSGDYISYFTRLSHPVLGRSNSLATVLVMLVPPLLYWGHTRKNLPATMVGTLTLFALVATQSRGVALAAAIAGLGYLVLMRRPAGRPRRRVLGKVVVATIGLAAGAAAMYELNAPTREFAGARLSTENVTLRAELYRQASEAVMARPLLGYGEDAASSTNGALAVDVHNSYVQQMVNFGLPLGILAGLAIAAIPVVFLMRRAVNPLAGAAGFAVLTEIIAFSFESSYEGAVLRVIFYLSLGLLAGLLRAVESETSLHPTSRPPPGGVPV